jgi:hypothetical protein
MAHKLCEHVVLVLLTATLVVSAQVAPAPSQSAPAQGSSLQPQAASTSLGPDLPLDSIPAKAVSVEFVVEHRSALNGHGVRVSGVISHALLGNAACPPDRGLCAQPSIFLADPERGKDKANAGPEIRIIMPRDAKSADYPAGKAIELQATVQGSKGGLVLTKLPD